MATKKRKRKKSSSGDGLFGTILKRVLDSASKNPDTAAGFAFDTSENISQKITEMLNRAKENGMRAERNQIALAIYAGMSGASGSGHWPERAADAYKAADAFIAERDRQNGVIPPPPYAAPSIPPMPKSEA